MSNSFKWHAEKQGTVEREDNPTAQVVTKDIDTLAKEPTQNSNDQRKDQNKVVKIRFGLISLTGEFKRNFLKAMKWESLQPHLKAISEVENLSRLTNKIRSGLKEIDENESLTLLKVEDFNTKGLIGEEFGDNDGENNFKLFCKADFSTSMTPGRGGSYGVGKYVFWQFSNISTVLMSSRVQGKENKGLRILEGQMYHRIN